MLLLLFATATLVLSGVCAVPVRRDADGVIREIPMVTRRLNRVSSTASTTTSSTTSALASHALLGEQNDELFVVTLAEYVGRKYSQLAEQYARLVLQPSSRTAQIDQLDLSFLAEAGKFLKHSMLTHSESPQQSNLAELKASLMRRTSRPLALDPFDDADIPVEGDEDDEVRFRSLVNMLPHMCKLEKYKDFRPCKRSG